MLDIINQTSDEIVQCRAPKISLDDPVKLKEILAGVPVVKRSRTVLIPSSPLARGGYGEVFKGVRDGALVAVKRMISLTREKEKYLTVSAVFFQGLK